MWQRARLRLIIFVASSLLTLWTAATLAQEMQPGEQYQGVIVACSRQDEAETLTGLVVSGDLEKAKTYLQSEDNSCDVGPYQFIVVEQVGETRIDAAGNAWKIVEITLPKSAADAYLLTTADLIAGSNT